MLATVSRKTSYVTTKAGGVGGSSTIAAVPSKALGTVVPALSFSTRKVCTKHYVANAHVLTLEKIDETVD
jgi:hypothetical protein